MTSRGQGVAGPLPRNSRSKRSHSIPAIPITLGPGESLAALVSASYPALPSPHLFIVPKEINLREGAKGPGRLWHVGRCKERHVWKYRAPWLSGNLKGPSGEGQVATQEKPHGPSAC